MVKTADHPTNYQLDETHVKLRNRVREFAKKEISPIARHIDTHQKFPFGLFQNLAGAGYAGTGVPPKYHGSFSDYLSIVLIGEELARVSASVPVALFPHAILCAHNLYLSGTDSQKKRYLPLLASGKKWGAMALAEISAGSDVLSIRTRALRSAGGYVLKGSKTLITNVPFAEIYLVIARTSEERGPENISAFIVEKEYPGFRTGKIFDKMGMRGSPTGRILFKDCEVPYENLVGGNEGKGYWQLLEGMDAERVSWASIALGIADASFESAISYATRRKQFGKPIGSFQLIQSKIADMAVDLQAAKLLTYNAANLLDRGKMARIEASSAKLFASEAAVKISGDAVQIYGGAGYMKDYAVERYFRDAKVLTIAAGSSEIQRLIVAHELKGNSQRILGENK